MDLSIVIISWNVEGLLAKCLASIESQGTSLNYEVIVVDSASRDNSVAMVRERFPWVKLTACEENIGYVRGNNLGARQATGRLLMLLNPDTEVLPGSLERLVEVLESDASIGVVGPHTLNSDGSHQPSRHRFPTVWTGVFESTWLEAYAPKRLMTQFRVTDMPNEGTYPVGWVRGSCLLTYRALWNELGGFDERYVMYSEELDYCKRVHDKGWQIYYVGDARIIHHSGQSTSQVKTRSHVHFQHSKLRYFRKFHGVGAAVLLRVVIVLNYLWQIGLEGAKWLVGHKRPLRRERVRAYWLVVRSLLGAGEQVAMR